MITSGNGKYEVWLKQIKLGNDRIYILGGGEKSHMGGVGKTATVVNLGAALSLNKKKVLIVDMDPQHGATSGLGVQVEDGMAHTYDLMTTGEQVPAEDAILNTKWKGLDLIPAHVDLAGAEVELINEPGRENRLK